METVRHLYPPPSSHGSSLTPHPQSVSLCTLPGVFLGYCCCFFTLKCKLRDHRDLVCPGDHCPPSILRGARQSKCTQLGLKEPMPFLSEPPSLTPSSQPFPTQLCQEPPLTLQGLVKASLPLQLLLGQLLWMAVQVQPWAMATCTRGKERKPCTAGLGLPREGVFLYFTRRGHRGWQYPDLMLSAAQSQRNSP